MGDVVYRSHVEVDRAGGPLRYVRVPAEDAEVVYGVRREVAAHYGLPEGQYQTGWLSVWAGLTGEHRVKAHELPYAEQAESGPQHRVERGRGECPVICPGDEFGSGGTVGVTA
jgi:hypothetical protein